MVRESLTVGGRLGKNTEHSLVEAVSTAKGSLVMAIWSCTINTRLQGNLGEWRNQKAAVLVYFYTENIEEKSSTNNFFS